ncbi:MAG: hypothetical protein HY901_25590 [Deltaproteobacteria bacterium]|nr:hypothetical protein [Deltaproteobacteria bacterium]
MPTRALCPAMLAVAFWAAVGCSRSAGPGEPIAGVYATKGTAVTVRGDPNAPVVRRAQAGVTLLSDMTLEVEKGGVVVESFDGSFLWFPSGKHLLRRLKPLSAPTEGTTRRIVWITDKAVPRELPTPVVAARSEPAQSGKPLKDPAEEQFGSDFAFFFFPHDYESEEEAPGPKAPAPPPWMNGNPLVHPLRRPLKMGDGARSLVKADGAVVVELTDLSTAFADSLKLPLDLSEVRRVVVAQGSARIQLANGQGVELKAGEIAELGPLH